MSGKPRRYPPAYLREFRPYMHPHDRDTRNPRLMCPCCRRWLTLWPKGSDTKRFHLYCPYNDVNRLHLVPHMSKQPVLCSDCCDFHCKRRAAAGITEPVKRRAKPSKPPRATMWDSSGEDTPASETRIKFVLSQQALGTLNRCDIPINTPFEMLTDVQVARLLSQTKPWRFYRAQGDERARFFLERLQRLANTKI